MKKVVYIIMASSFLTLSSCADWLDVQPKAEIKSDVMFSTEQGFKDAITGCYIMMSDRNLYGGEMTCTFMEVLGQQYDLLDQGNSYKRASEYSYTDSGVSYVIDNIWSKSYNVIANINNIIDNIDKNKNVLHPTNYAVIKGEAYGLRAYIYFDLIRMFGHGNIKDRVDILSKPAIPYAKEYDKATVKQHTLGQVLEFIHADIETAYELLSIYDPWSNRTKPDDYTIPNEDKSYDDSFRPYRFNIKAVHGLRMRVNMWEGNYDKALEDARVIINGGGKMGTNWISDYDINNAAIEQRDLTFSSEQLFGLETFERFDKIILNRFKLLLSDNANMNTQCLYLTKAHTNAVYEIGSGNNVGNSDYRYLRWFDVTTDNCAFLKYWEYEKMKFKNNVPLIRISEAYYTAAECLLNLGDDASRREAINLVNQVRNARNIPMSVNLSNELSAEDAKIEVYKEWRKEFLGDGQMFYYYKRLGYATIPGSGVSADDVVYMFPLPQTEVDMAGRVNPNDKLNNKK